jgi:hypothetical protein
MHSQKPHSNLQHSTNESKAFDHRLWISTMRSAPPIARSLLGLLFRPVLYRITHKVHGQERHTLSLLQEASNLSGTGRKYPHPLLSSPQRRMILRSKAQPLRVAPRIDQHPAFIPDTQMAYLEHIHPTNARLLFHLCHSLQLRATPPSTPPQETLRRQNLKKIVSHY